MIIQVINALQAGSLVHLGYMPFTYVPGRAIISPVSSATRQTRIGGDGFRPSTSDVVRIGGDASVA